MSNPEGEPAPGSKRLKLEVSTSHRPMTGLLVPDHRDERAPNPRDPASAQPGPEGSATCAIRLMGTHGEPHAQDEAAGPMKSPPIGQIAREFRRLATLLLGWVC